MALSVRCKDISKVYKLGQISTGTLSRDIEQFVTDKWVKYKSKTSSAFPEKKNEHEENKQYHWSLKDINFDLEQGDTLALIGKNGAGKSTLLKILSRITMPSSGRIFVKGRVSSLLEVGTGFHPELSGRDNIYLNGAVLGMKRKEVRRKFDEIVAFSGVEKFIDTPVKRYSSGMYVRLAFAVAAHLESDILLVDEVLAVGDHEFQKKCLGKMDEISKGMGKTLLFVSHNMEAIKNVCNKGIVLQHGEVHFEGTCTDAISTYLTQSVKNLEVLNNTYNADSTLQKLESAGEHAGFQLKTVSIQNCNGQNTSKFNSKNEVFIKCVFTIKDHYSDFRIIVNIKDKSGKVIFLSQMADSIGNASSLNPGTYVAICKIPAFFLGSGIYGVDVLFYHVGRFTVALSDTLFFSNEFLSDNYTTASFSTSAPLRPKLPWTFTKCNTVN
jgi:lipopolysaccharide transport system ATP-binding protein